MSIVEYLHRIKAHRLKRVDIEYDMHLSAWLNERVGAMKEQGKKQVPVFKKFVDFFDYAKRVNEINGTKDNKISDQHKRMAQLAMMANKSRKEDNNG